MNFKFYLTIIFAVTSLVSCKPKRQNQKTIKTETTVERIKDSIKAKPILNEHQLENQYLTLRNEYILEFKNYDFVSKPIDSFFKNNNNKLKTLKQKLLQITKNHPLKNHIKNGEIVLESLSNGFVGYGLLDCLKTDQDSSTIYITTKYLLKKYLEKQNIDFKNRFNNIQLGEIIQSTQPGIAFINMNTSRLKLNQNEIKVSLGVLSQDPHPFQNTKTLFLTWEMEKYIYIMKLNSNELKLMESSEFWENYKHLNMRKAFSKYGLFYSKDSSNIIELNKAHKRIEKNLNILL